MHYCFSYSGNYCCSSGLVLILLFFLLLIIIIVCRPPPPRSNDGAVQRPPHLHTSSSFHLVSGCTKHLLHGGFDSRARNENLNYGHGKGCEAYTGAGRRAQMLSQQMRKLRQKADDFIGLAQDLSSNYAQHINSANSLLAHFQVCVSRASARRKGSVGHSDHDELTKVHLVTSQVLKSYLLWLERSKHRRQRSCECLGRYTLNN